MTTTQKKCISFFIENQMAKREATPPCVVTWEGTWGTINCVGL
jgi:hypothetical protein